MEAYVKMVKQVLLETPSVAAADVTALLAFREDNQIDFEVCYNSLHLSASVALVFRILTTRSSLYCALKTHVKALRNLQITNAEFEQFVVVRLVKRILSPSNCL